MTTILDEIIAYKRKEVAAAQEFIDEDTLIAYIEMSPDEPRGFMNALRECQAVDCIAVIAEVKKASPSAGVIRPDFQPKEIALAYAENDATCLSVLTDRKFFQGNPLYLRRIRQSVSLPLLRKDFIVDEYQIIESRAMGADCILLIAAVLNDEEMLRFTRLAHDLGMDVLVEVHNAEEFERAIHLPVQAIGVNNRNLHDFSVDIQISMQLAEKLPQEMFLISESGISSHADIKALQQHRINAFLVGGSLMKASDPGAALKQLING